MSTLISLSQNQFAIIDDDDVLLINNFDWYLFRDPYNCYAFTVIKLANGRKRTLRMHRLILNPFDNQGVDHINNNGLDNRRDNLRIATQSQNNANRRKFINCTSQYKGVSWWKDKSKWTACINVNHKRTFLGYFHDEKEAAEAYNCAAINLFGKFAKLNII